MQTTDNKEALLHKKKRFEFQYNALKDSKPEEAALFKKGIDAINKELAELEKKNEQSLPSEQDIESQREQETPQQKSNLLAGLKAMVTHAQSNNPKSVQELINVGKDAAGLQDSEKK